MSNLGVIDTLHKATEGLQWMSESDYPLEPFFWKSEGQEGLDIQTLLQKSNHSLDTPVKVVEFDKFFRRATTEREWHNESERQTVRRYRWLVEVLKRNLTNLRVYRVGKTTIDVYIVGQLPSGDWAGLSTKSIET